MWFTQNYVNSCLAWAALHQTDPRQGMMPVVGVAKGPWVPPPSSESTWNPLKNPFCPGRSTVWCLAPVLVSTCSVSYWASTVSRVSVPSSPHRPGDSRRPRCPLTTLRLLTRRPENARNIRSHLNVLTTKCSPECFDLLRNMLCCPLARIKHSIYMKIFSIQVFGTPLRNTATGQVMGRDGSWWEEGRVWTQTREDFSFRGRDTDRAGRQGLDISKTYYHKQDTWCQHNYLNVCPEICSYHLTHLIPASADQWGVLNTINKYFQNSFAKQCKVFLPS